MNNEHGKVLFHHSLGGRIVILSLLPFILLIGVNLISLNQSSGVFKETQTVRSHLDEHIQNVQKTIISLNDEMSNMVVGINAMERNNLNMLLMRKPGQAEKVREQNKIIQSYSTNFAEYIGELELHTQSISGYIDDGGQQEVEDIVVVTNRRINRLKKDVGRLNYLLGIVERSNKNTLALVADNNFTAAANNYIFEEYARVEVVVKSVETMAEVLDVIATDLNRLQSAKIRAANAEGAQALSDNKRWSYLALALVSISLIFALLFTVRLMVVNSINRFVDTIIGIEQQSDLTLRADDREKSELGHVSGALNKLLGNIQQVLQKSHSSMTRLGQETGAMNAVMEQANGGVQQQSKETDQVASAINELLHSVTSVSEQTEVAADLATQANDEAQKSKDVVGRTVADIEILSNDIEAAVEVVTGVNNNSENIGSVLGVIRGIADQTNLLALNAAIEAARAGEQGRGFAVVADEVRSLAQRTQESTEEIQTMIESLQGQSEKAVAAMDASQTRMLSTVEQVSEAEEMLDSIASAMTGIQDMSCDVASSVTQQKNVVNNINSSIQRIREIALQTATGAKEGVHSSNNLIVLTEELQSMLEQFKVS